MREYNTSTRGTVLRSETGGTAAVKNTLCSEILYAIKGGDIRDTVLLRSIMRRNEIEIRHTFDGFMLIVRDDEIFYPGDTTSPEGAAADMMTRLMHSGNCLLSELISPELKAALMMMGYFYTEDAAEEHRSISQLLRLMNKRDLVREFEDAAELSR